MSELAEAHITDVLDATHIQMCKTGVFVWTHAAQHDVLWCIGPHIVRGCVLNFFIDLDVHEPEMRKRLVHLKHT